MIVASERERRAWWRGRTMMMASAATARGSPGPMAPYVYPSVAAVTPSSARVEARPAAKASESGRAVPLPLS